MYEHTTDFQVNMPGRLYMSFVFAPGYSRKISGNLILTVQPVMRYSLTGVSTIITDYSEIINFWHTNPPGHPENFQTTYNKTSLFSIGVESRNIFRTEIEFLPVLDRIAYIRALCRKFRVRDQVFKCVLHEFSSHIG